MKEKRANRCQQLEDRNDKREVAQIPATGSVAELTLEYLPISNIRLQMGSIQLQIVILEFAFSCHSDVRCQMLQNGWLLRMGSTHLATGMMLG